jgi:hypothetical protein
VERSDLRSLPMRARQGNRGRTAVGGHWDLCPLTAIKSRAWSSRRVSGRRAPPPCEVATDRLIHG